MSKQVFSDRRTGKTTRLVDKAIQRIFTVGYLMIPKEPFKINPLVGRGTTIQDSKEFVDNEGNSRCQKHLIDTIKKRLELEHSNLGTGGFVETEETSAYTLFKTK